MIKTRYDLVGLGIGPFNLSLAALAQPISSIKSLFLDKNPGFNWHPGLLLDGCSLQVPFMADLVTLAKPSHPLSFLEYLHQQKRLYNFYFLENFHIPRQEYNHYCQWVCRQLDNMQFNTVVESIDLNQIYNKNYLEVTYKNLETKLSEVIYAKNIVLGLGSVPYIPASIKIIPSEYIQHSSNYLSFSQNLLPNIRSICVIGSGQSAAEIVLHLLNEQNLNKRKIYWITRSRGFFPMEYSKLGLEHFSPEYMRYFYHLKDQTKKNLIKQQDLMYKGISQETIAAIFDKLYELTVANATQPLEMYAHCEVSSISSGDQAHRFNLDLNHWQASKTIAIAADAVVLATGYKPASVPLTPLLKNYLIADDNQQFSLEEDFSIKTRVPILNKIFVQGNSLHSHGIGSPDLGLGCYRNSIILNTITQETPYPIHAKNVFQTFTHF